MLISKIRSQKLRQKLLGLPDKSYHELCEIAKGEELAERQAREIQDVSRSTVYNVSQQQEGTSWSSKPGQSQAGWQNRGSPTGCGWCGGPRRHKRSNCPAEGRECYNCNGIGHLARVCRNGRQMPAHQNGDERRWYSNRSQSDKESSSDASQNASGCEFEKLFEVGAVEMAVKDSKATKSSKKSYAEAVKEKSQPNQKKMSPPSAKERESSNTEFTRQARDYRQNRLRIGEKVLVQDWVTKRWTQEAIVVRQGKSEREYWIRMPSGAVYRKPWNFLKSDPSYRQQSAEVAQQRANPVSEVKLRSQFSSPVQLKSIQKKSTKFKEQCLSEMSQRA
jgi:hypothetical protein